jgi:hypothetical protein
MEIIIGSQALRPAGFTRSNWILSIVDIIGAKTQGLDGLT